MIGVSSVQEGLKLLQENHGEVTFSLVCAAGEWSVMIVAGREAEGSPMAGGAAYGLDPDLVAAIKQALANYRIDLVVDTEREVR